MPVPDMFSGVVDTNLDLKVSADFPALLFPCQIETRFFNRILKIRIYPDQFLSSSFDSKLTKTEFDDARKFHDADEKDREAVWRELASTYDPSRASWIIYQATGVNSLQEYQLPDHDILPEIALLPDFFLVTVFPENSDPIRKWKKLEGPLSMMDISAEGLFKGKAAWISDFEIAKKAGMAFEFSIPDPINVISKITAVGIRQDSDDKALLDLLAFHHYTDGASIVVSGTPTNNSESEASAYSSEENEDERYKQEFLAGDDLSDGSAAVQLAKALGLGKKGEQLFSKWKDGTKEFDPHSKDIHRVLWDVTGGYFLKKFLNGVIDPENEKRLRKQFEEYVRPMGHLPSVMIKNLPYGILPVSQLGGWSPTVYDSKHLDGSTAAWKTFDKTFHETVIQFSEQWKEAAENPFRVPRIGYSEDDDYDPEVELAKVLSMSASGENYALRPYVDDRMLAWHLMQFKSDLFNSLITASKGEDEWAQEWVETWLATQQGLKQFLQETGVKPNKIPRLNLLKFIAWEDSKSIDMPLTHSKINPNDKPDNYIPILDAMGGKAPEDASETLLYWLLRRALKSSPDSKPWKLLERANEETEQKILEFFNQAKSAQEIVDRFVDDPKHNLAAPAHRVYAVRKKLAERIINEKDSLSDKNFTNIKEIDAIRGVGEDTLQDIYYSFSRKVEGVDYESLLKSVLDSFTYRLDAWISSQVAKRLDSMRRNKPEGVVVGAYGFVENLSVPEGAVQAKLSSGGYIHAPSVNQAATATLLKSGYMSHENDANNPYPINLSSDRIRRAQRVIQGVREGQELGALLGYQFERELHNRDLDQYKDEFREAYPLVIHVSGEEVTDTTPTTDMARNVVNGRGLVKGFEKASNKDELVALIAGEANTLSAVERSGLMMAIESIRDTLDAVSDLMVHESVFQAVTGNYERSGAAQDAASSHGSFPELESVTTPLEKIHIGHNSALIFDSSAEEIVSTSPREKAEPKIAVWFDRLLGAHRKIGCCVEFHQVDSDGIHIDLERRIITLDKLSLSSIDFLYLSAMRPGGGDSELESRIKQWVRGHYVRVVETIRIKNKDEESEVKLAVKKGDEHDSEIKYEICQKPIQIDFSPFEFNAFKPDDRSAYEKGMDDAIELAQQAMLLLSQSHYLRPDHLSSPQSEFKSEFSEQDYTELHQRADDALNNFRSKAEKIEHYTIPLSYLEDFQSVYGDIEQIVHSRHNLSAGTLSIAESITQLVEAPITKAPNISDATKQELADKIEVLLDDVDDGLTLNEALQSISADLLSFVKLKFKMLLVGLLLETEVDEQGVEHPRFDPEVADKVDSKDFPDGIPDAIGHIKSNITNSVNILRGYGLPLNTDTAASLQAMVNAAIDRLHKSSTCLNDAEAVAAANDQNPNNKMSKGIDCLVKGMKALFGENFVVLPQFTAPEKNKFDKYIKAQEKVLMRQPQSRVYLWLQQAAAAHRGLRQFEDFLLIGEAWKGKKLFPPRVVQFPYQYASDENTELADLQDSLGWQALSNEELGIVYPPNTSAEEREEMLLEKRPRQSMGVVAFCDGDVTADKISGLFLDHWTEEMPMETIDSGVALHADTPNQQPPNCCLLAVPGHRKEPGHGSWTAGELEAIVSDTLDLAKIRAVDLDALPDMKGLLPALFLPIAPEQDFFEEEKIQLKRIDQIPLFEALFNSGDQ